MTTTAGNALIRFLMMKTAPVSCRVAVVVVVGTDVLIVDAGLADIFFTNALPTEEEDWVLSSGHDYGHAASEG